MPSKPSKWTIVDACGLCIRVYGVLLLLFMGFIAILTLWSLIFGAPRTVSQLATWHT
jgi:hypothetical protein